MTSRAKLYDPFAGHWLASQQDRLPGPRRRRKLMRLHQRELDASLAHLGRLAIDDEMAPEQLVDEFRAAALAVLQTFARVLDVPSDDDTDDD